MLKSRVFFPKYHRPTLLDQHSSFCTPKVSSLIYRPVLTYILSFCTQFYCKVRFSDYVYMLFKSLRIHPRIHVRFFDHFEEDLVPLLPAVLSYYPRGHQWIRTRFCGRDHQFQSRWFSQLDPVLPRRKARTFELSWFCLYQTGTSI